MGFSRGPPPPQAYISGLLLSLIARPSFLEVANALRAPASTKWGHHLLLLDVADAPAPAHGDRSGFSAEAFQLGRLAAGVDPVAVGGGLVECNRCGHGPRLGCRCSLQR